MKKHNIVPLTACEQYVRSLKNNIFNFIVSSKCTYLTFHIAHCRCTLIIQKKKKKRNDKGVTLCLTPLLQSCRLVNQSLYVLIYIKHFTYSKNKKL